MPKWNLISNFPVQNSAAIIVDHQESVVLIAEFAE